MDYCQYCSRPLAGDICPAHGYVGIPVEKAADVIPIGLIAMWSGSLATIPLNWALCNGTLGTPNLQDKFVLGAGSTAPGSTGGSNAHTHSVSVTGASDGSGTSGSGGGDLSYYVSAQPAFSDHGNHTHTIYIFSQNVYEEITPFNQGSGSSLSRAPATHTHYVSGTSEVQNGTLSHSISTNVAIASSGGNAHTHSLYVTGGSNGSGTASSGGIGVAYYALAYIMKIA